MRKINYIRRSLLLLLVLALFVSVPLSANATEITEDKTYILIRPKKGSDNLYPIPPFQYESCYAPGYDFDNAYAPGTVLIWADIYTMYNPITEEQIPTYCSDIKTGAYDGFSYRLLNLEDSTFSGNSAGLIRAILGTGFYIHRSPNESISEHEANLTNKIDAKMAALREATGIADLNVAEAITATQTAIWRAAHGTRVTFPLFCRSVAPPTKSLVRYYDYCYDTSMKSKDKATVSQNIETLYEYLISLPPVPAAETEMLVSSASFKNINKSVFTQNDDGTYNVSISTSVFVNMIAGDTLTLAATLNGSESQPTVALSNGTNNVTLTFNNVPATAYNNQVKLSISGYQTVAGYFLFDAVGERDSAQTMVGYSNSRMPVYAEVIAEDSRILNINKSTADFTPISDIIFDIYYASTLDEESIAKLPDAETNPLKNTMAEYTLITNANGEASLNLTQHGLSDGVYLLVERYSPKVVEPLPPFYVTIPSDVPGQDPYNVTVYAKNQLKDVPVVTPKGGIRLTKVDQASNDPLPNAVFEIYRNAQVDELDAGVSIPGITAKVVKVPFYLDEAMTGDLVTEVTSGSDGSFGIYGLVYGDYYLVEKQAPDGYNLMDEPLTITIDENSLNSSNQNPVTVYNKKGTLLPDTGGMGTTLFTTSGGALIFVACLFLFINKRKVRKEA